VAVATEGKRRAAKSGDAAASPAAKKRTRGSRGPTRWTRVRESEEVRWSRVLSAQVRIASDYYEREDVKDFLVDAVLEELTSH
jgi:hypothetical protein